MSPALPAASPAYDKLISLLRELFQLDQPDLDFGLYRVLHARAAEIDKFLSQDLLPQVRKEFAHYQPADKAAIQQELAQAIAQAESLGADPETLPKVKTLRERLATEAVDLGGLEREVFDHLYAFFRRYYAEGDFLARRVYKEGTYAIPYEGEEVKLHWANRDQYYIKTSEYLRDYAFRLRPTDKARPMRVHFRLADAAEGEHGNVKAAEGKDRVFILRDGAAAYALDAKAQELTFFFEYRPATPDDQPAPDAAPTKKKTDDGKPTKPKPPTQKELLQAAKVRIEALAAADAALAPWLAELAQPHTRADGSTSDKTRLQVNLERYTARNTFDYFIHKDLGGFLQRELDFYLKNEVLHLDNIEADTAPRVEQFLSKLRVLRKVAHHLIDFLAQLEDFQRKLWLKKKFVVDTQWCVTLDKLPAALLPAVTANEAQRQEWVELFGIEALAADAAKPGYSVPLTVGFLQAYPHLVLDTRHFPAAFTERLLAELDGNLDELTDGLLIHGENFQALNLLQERYKEQVRSIYIDPPYNTDASEILYKNGYKSSSWIALMDSRLEMSRSLLTDKGVIVAAIDDAQQRELSFLLSQTFDGNTLGTITVRSNPSGRPTKEGYAVSHEYLLFAGNSAGSKISRMPPTPAQMARFNREDEDGLFEWRNLRREGSDSERQDRPAMYFPIYISGDQIRLPKMEWDEPAKTWIILEKPAEGEKAVLPDNEDGVQKRWRWDSKKVRASIKELAVRKDRSGQDYIYCKRRPNEEGVVSVSTWSDAKYSATEHGTALLKKLFYKSPFDYPKSLHAVVDAVYIAGGAKPNTTILDYFGGSGTTAHAVIELNRRDKGHRKYILTEMGAHFNTALLKRIKKVVFAKEWEDGKPTAFNTGVSQCIKVIRLESYEDTLNNLKLQRAEPVQITLFPATDTPAIAAARQDYVLRYLLDVESRGSRSLLDVPAFQDPTAYTLDVKAPGSDQTETQAVDLLETFNYLLGLRVHQVGAPQTLVAEFDHADHVEPGDGAGRLRLKGSLRKAATGPWWVRPVTGALADGRRVLIIWRKLTADAAQDNLVLNAWFEKHDYSVRDTEFDLIYVNGDNNLENLRQPDDTWKVQLIEEAFHRLLFAE